MSARKGTLRQAQYTPSTTAWGPHKPSTCCYITPAMYLAICRPGYPASHPRRL